jgi:hypothetical protein
LGNRIASANLFLNKWHAVFVKHLRHNFSLQAEHLHRQLSYTIAHRKYLQINVSIPASSNLPIFDWILHFLLEYQQIYIAFIDFDLLIFQSLRKLVNLDVLMMSTQHSTERQQSVLCYRNTAKLSLINRRLTFMEIDGSSLLSRAQSIRKLLSVVTIDLTNWNRSHLLLAVKL